MALKVLVNVDQKSCKRLFWFGFFFFFQINLFFLQFTHQMLNFFSRITLLCAR